MTDARPLGADEATFIAVVRSGDTARFAPLEQLVARPAPADVVAGCGDVAVQGHVHAEDEFRIVPASRESISHVQTGAARKPNLCVSHDCVTLPVHVSESRSTPHLLRRTFQNDAM
jgi:hypothetical protein